MASKENKTSKTARVMNLLSKKPDSASAGEAAEASSAPVPPILSSMAPDAAVSVQIKNALEDALENELDPQAQAAPAQEQPDPALWVGLEPEAVPRQAEPAAPEAAPAPQPAPQAEPAPQPEPAPKWNVPQQPASPGYINVMQVLVEERTPKYVKMFGLCQCERCLEDVKALTLNNLPPKYVVLEQGDMIPRLTVYEGKFSSDITAQLLQACKVVMQTPHHNR